MGSGLKTALGVLFGMLILAVVGSERAIASGCNCTPPPPPCCTPPTPPTPPQTPCCTPPGHNINVPGVTVNVNASVIVNANVAAQANVLAGAASQANGSAQTVVYGGGGGSGGGMAPGPVTVMGGLNVQGGKEMRRVAYQATRTKTTKVVIQAFCLDDKSVPHPASQVFPEKDVEDSYDGELFRCIAGTRMQYTWAEYIDHVSFDGGHIVTCDKDSALWHSKEGKTECRPQTPARDCNERSLLRRFGAGVKILTMVTTETYTAYREEETESSASSSGSISFSGGVGGYAY